jgi:hypothetical protein
MSILYYLFCTYLFTDYFIFYVYIYVYISLFVLYLHYFILYSCLFFIHLLIFRSLHQFWHPYHQLLAQYKFRIRLLISLLILLHYYYWYYYCCRRRRRHRPEISWLWFCSLAASNKSCILRQWIRFPKFYPEENTRSMSFGVGGHRIFKNPGLTSNFHAPEEWNVYWEHANIMRHLIHNLVATPPPRPTPVV